MSLLSQYEIATNLDFIHRVEQAALARSISVMQEDPAAVGGPEAHALRAAFAAQVLHAPGRAGRKLAMAIVSTGQITDDSTDAQIGTAVNIIWNPMSGYNPNA
jgi:hypothetical protein